MSDIDKVIQYVAGLDPAFAGAIKGAEQAEIAEVERLAHEPLPPLYREFLQRFGRSVGGLTIHKAKFDIETVLGFYRRPTWELPSGAFYIGKAVYDDVPCDICLYEGHVVSVEPPARGEELDPTTLMPIAGNLTEMIGAAAFRHWRMNIHSQGARFYQDDQTEDSPNDVARILEPLGFSKHWFSSDWDVICESGRTGVVAMKGINSVLIVDCASADPEMIKKIGVRLDDNFGMTKLPVDGLWRNQQD